MSDVFSPTPPRYGIIGDGRMARHMSHYLQLLSLPHLRWSRREHPNEFPHDRLADCDVVLLLVKDSAIEHVVQMHRDLARKTLVHFSGSLFTPDAQGMHPLFTFADTLYDLQTYRHIPFVCDEGDPGFADVFPNLPNPHYTIPRQLKPLYHSMAVMAGNFTTILWRKLFHTFEEQLHVPPQTALPYMEQIVDNLKRDPDRAQTGPISRGDQETIEQNLAALEGDPFRDVYIAFLNTTGAFRSGDRT